MKRKPASCLLCVNLAQSETDFKAHFVSHHVHSVFLCDLCHRIFYQEVDVNQHVTSHLVAKVAAVSFVKQEVVASIDVTYSLGDAQKDDNFLSTLFTHACDLCNLAFPSVTDLKAHILTHRVENGEIKTDIAENSISALNDSSTGTYQWQSS